MNGAARRLNEAVADRALHFVSDLAEDQSVTACGAPAALRLVTDDHREVRCADCQRAMHGL